MSIREFLWRLLAPKRDEPEPEPVSTRRFRFVVTERPESPPVDPDGFTVEMAISLHTIAGLFAFHGWQLARPGTGPQPSALELGALLAEMVNTVDAEGPDGENAFYQFARFIAVRSDDFPDDVDLYLHIGTATRDAPPDDGDPIDPTELVL